MSQRHDLALLFDLFERYQLAAIAARTMPCSFLPRFWAFEIRVPKGPRAALARAGIVDLARAAFAMEENAIPVWKLDEAPADADLADVAPLELRNFQIQEQGQLLDLFFIDPNITRCSGAAIAALGALEFQAGVIPRFFFCSHSANDQLFAGRRQEGGDFRHQPVR